MHVYKNYINGEWVAARTGDTFENRNPAHLNEVLGLFQASDSSDVTAAVDAATAAYKTWRLVPAPRRGEILYRAAQMILARKEELAQDMTCEMGKVVEEARGDVQEAIDMCFFMAGEGRRLHGQTTPAEMPSKFAMSVRQPLGIVGLITPWNFPMAIPSWKILPALICGNTVVLKPAQDTPLSALHLVDILNAAGLPPGVLNLVTGTGSNVGTPLVAHDGVRMVSFTGSTEVGRTVSKARAAAGRPCSLEMGGKNVVMIMEDGDLDLAVDGCLWAGFGTTGQRCTAASRVVVHKQVYREFLDRYVQRAARLKVGDGLDPANQVGPLINRAHAANVDKYVQIGREEGAKIALGGTPLTDGAYADGCFYAPTIFSDVDPKMRIAREEIFGPVVAVIPCDGLDEAIEIGNSVDYGLSAAVYTSDVNKAFTAMRDMYTGIFYVNAPTIGAEIHLPFGGTKDTGNGHREAGIAALDAFSEWKSIYIDFSGKLQRAQIDL
jgi:aldehyde dehydrogenase (NAD+)